MPETIFPRLSGLNWPSYLLEAWRTLHALGVPEEHIRLIPEFGHFAAPEIFAQEPPGPEFDPHTNRATVYQVDTDSVRPRLTVGVRGEIVTEWTADGTSREKMVGRLAHFLTPLLEGVPGVEPPTETGEPPIDRMTRHVAALYPELLATLPESERVALETGVDDILAALSESDPTESVRSAGRKLIEDARPAARAAWRRYADTLAGIEGIDPFRLPPARAVFREWGDALFGSDPDAPQTTAFVAELSETQREEQRVLLRALLDRLVFENERERLNVIRELMEIVATEAFTATAVIDSLCGIGWIHGAMSEVNLAGRATHPDGLFLSITGGWNAKTLLLSRLRAWADAGPLLGVAPGELDALDETQRMELWSLVAWRRDAADAAVLLETACQRLVHPEIVVSWTRFAPVHARPATLLAQPGKTAVLGGPALLHSPGIVVSVPLAREASPDAERLLDVLLRLFLPVSCRVEIVWAEARALLGETSFLRHEFAQSTLA